jgi:hypothetical protein
MMQVRERCPYKWIKKDCNSVPVHPGIDWRELFVFQCLWQRYFVTGPEDTNMDPAD